MIKRDLSANVKKTFSKGFIFSKNKSYFVFVVIPVIVSFIYLVFISTPRYESTTVLSLNQNQNNQISSGGFSSLVSGANSEIVTKSHLLIDYIRSQAMLKHLEDSVKLSDLYKDSSIDFISRASKDMTQQEFLDYYNSMIAIDYNIDANSITIKAQGFSAIDAHTMLEHIVYFSQARIDSISHILAKNRMKFMTEELDRIKAKAIESQQNLVAFQSNKGIISPESSLGSKSQILSELQSELAEAEASLSQLKSYLSPTAAEVVTKEQKIAALKKQIDIEKKAFLNSKNNGEKQSELGNIVADYQWLKLESDFAMKEYASTLDSYEEAQMDSARQQTYLVEVMKPTLPDAAKYPRVLHDAFLIFIMLSVMYGIVRMIITIILEHR